KKYHCPSVNPLQFALENYPGVAGTPPASSYQSTSPLSQKQQAAPPQEQQAPPQEKGPAPEKLPVPREEPSKKGTADPRQNLAIPPPERGGGGRYLPPLARWISVFSYWGGEGTPNRRYVRARPPRQGQCCCPRRFERCGDCGSSPVRRRSVR